MNIEVIGRVRPSIRGEGPPTLIVDSHNKMASRPGGTYFTFSGFHRQETSNYDVYRTTVEPLLELFVAGFNTSLIVTGESGSGKSFTVSGENAYKSGIVPLLLEGLFQRTEKDGDSYYDNHLHTDHVSMQIYEIYNELIKDLMVVPGVYTENLDVQENPEKGSFVKNLSTATVSSASDGASLFRQAFSRRTESPTDFGPAKNHAAIIIHINLSMKTSESALPNQSRFTIVITPGIEKLQEDGNHIRVREGPTLSKSIISLSQLVATIANQPYADRVINYTESRLTYLLREEFGGNCKTRVLMCFRPQGDSNLITAALNLATQLSQVKNFPVINDHLTQQLIIQYRARIHNLQQQLGLGAGLSYTSHIHDANDELRKLQTGNLQLQDKNERLHMRLEQLQSNFGSLATTKTDLSTQLLMTEEEKLKVSKTLVEMQIENNKLKEEVEAAKFELTNKILQLEDSLIQTEVERDKHAKAAKNYKERLLELEKDRKTLAEEYIALKSSYLSISSAHEREVAKNEELSMELMNLVKAKAALLRKIDGEESSTAEIDRIRAIVSQAAKRSRDLPGRVERESFEKSLFSDEKHLKGEVDRIRDEYYDAERLLQDKMSSKNRQIAQLRDQVRSKQKKIAELNAQLITLRNTSEQVNLQNNRLQHKLKDINDEFKSRLVKYIEDIAEWEQIEERGLDVELGPIEEHLELSDRELQSKQQKGKWTGC
ncbi:hypothetical protein LSH36_145g07016 [Paralvinella palmiformis]|uniref:Kinesin motor domain-containing protein n=1 Tax=Paralvinella palmiformis TaxID=53620 RepID=A0AAD9JV31_9ANNE|nr:hypothetical protein LSH36_145g07016 [Paralvinella palmiformis]